MLCRDPCPPRAAPAAWARLRPRALPLPVRPGPARPRVCSCSRGGRLSLRGAEHRPPHSWWLRSFSRGSVSVQAPGSCVESTSLFHTTEVFYSCLSATLSRTPGDTVPGSLCQVPVCARREGALGSALGWRLGQPLAQTPCLRSFAGRAPRVTRPVWGPRAAGHAAALGTEAWQRPGWGKQGHRRV